MSTPLPPITAADLKQLLDGPNKPRLLDVREPHEFVSDLGHVAGSELVPLGTVANNLAKFEGEAREIVVICRSGMRAGQAAGFLAQKGFKTRVLTGGMLAWNEAKLPISRDPA
jgi:rhodanese-related sulfurtransferase